MTRFRKIIVFGLLIFVLGTYATPVVGAQNTWGGFWDGMQTALIRLETDPTLGYFNTLYDAAFANRDAVFGRMDARAAALTDIEVSFPIFIYEDNRAAYQKVVTGIFTQPYVSGNTTLPPTNAPIRFVWQGIMDASGAGQITGDYSVNDGFATFQELGAIPLAPGQEHGQIGLEPFAGTGEDVAVSPVKLFTKSLRANPVEAQELTLFGVWLLDNFFEGEDDALILGPVADSVEVHTNFGTGILSTDNSDALHGLGASASAEPEVKTNALVTQGNITAVHGTATLPPTDITLPGIQETVTIADSLEFDFFIFLLSGDDESIEEIYFMMDILRFLQAGGMNPATVTQVPINAGSQPKPEPTLTQSP